MADDLNVNEALGVFDGVENAIITQAKTPQILNPAKLPHTRGPGIGTELFNGGEDSPRH